VGRVSAGLSPNLDRFTWYGVWPAAEILGGLEGNDETGLRFHGVLQVEEFDTAGQLVGR
jgi:hypothetical protein